MAVLGAVKTRVDGDAITLADELCREYETGHINKQRDLNGDRDRGRGRPFELNKEEIACFSSNQDGQNGQVNSSCTKVVNKT